MKKVCDNVDCKGEYKQSELHKVEMTEEFEGEVATWCEECIERDKDMINWWEENGIDPIDAYKEERDRNE